MLEKIHGDLLVPTFVLTEKQLYEQELKKRKNKLKMTYRRNLPMRRVDRLAEFRLCRWQEQFPLGPMPKRCFRIRDKREREGPGCRVHERHYPSHALTRHVGTPA